MTKIDARKDAEYWQSQISSVMRMMLTQDDTVLVFTEELGVTPARQYLHYCTKMYQEASAKEEKSKNQIDPYFMGGCV